MIKSFYLNNIVYYIAASAAVVFVVSYFHPAMYQIGGMILLLLAIALLVDFILVYSKGKGIEAERIVSERFSIGDPNKVAISMHNHYGFPVRTSIIDEVPVQFQERKWHIKIPPATNKPAPLHYPRPH
jgi:uncharacterized protein (DUF58 family)